MARHIAEFTTVLMIGFGAIFGGLTIAELLIIVTGGS